MAHNDRIWSISARFGDTGRTCQNLESVLGARDLEHYIWERREQIELMHKVQARILHKHSPLKAGEVSILCSARLSANPSVTNDITLGLRLGCYVIREGTQVGTLEKHLGPVCHRSLDSVRSCPLFQIPTKLSESTIIRVTRRLRDNNYYPQPLSRYLKNKLPYFSAPVLSPYSRLYIYHDFFLQHHDLFLREFDPELYYAYTADHLCPCYPV
jgi:hypothetical protein